LDGVEVAGSAQRPRLGPATSAGAGRSTMRLGVRLAVGPTGSVTGMAPSSQQTTPVLPTAQDEVVAICQDLLRIDTSNYGDGSGPGERAAAEYVMASLHDVGLEPELFES